VVPIDDPVKRFGPCECMKMFGLKELWDHRNVPPMFDRMRFKAFKVEMYAEGENRELASFALGVGRKIIGLYNELITTFNGRGVYFYSKEKGSGKSMLAAIIVNELVLRGIRAKFVGMAELLQQIRDGFDPESSVSSASIIETAKAIPVLVLDDIGAERLTDWVEDVVYQILDYRLTHKKFTIFTSNELPVGLGYSERVKSRIDRMGMVVLMPEEEVRLKLSMRDDDRMREFFGGVK